MALSLSSQGAGGAYDQDLFHLSLNPEKETTIVLLHGLLGSHLEYAWVIPHLSNYHLLVVDLCGHSRSSAILPATIPSQADHVAALIRKHARNGKAHLVGLSMGGYVVCDLAKRYHELVQSAFVTGAPPMQGVGKWMVNNPATIWWLMKFMVSFMPAWLFHRLAAMRGMKVPDGLLEEMRGNLQWQTVEAVYGSVGDFLRLRPVAEHPAGDHRGRERRRYRCSQEDGRVASGAGFEGRCREGCVARMGLANAATFRRRYLVLDRRSAIARQVCSSLRI
jgi:pimeloyl-ACP methyl ester carboxylesterase